MVDSVRKFPKHQTKVEEMGHPPQGHGGKPARSRVRVVCTCGYEGPWRKLFSAMVEDQVAHTLARE
jgi:hypothetical protein